ncbi:MAG: PAS domain S-box protein, partial [Bdellovibrionota bacterium]
MSTSRTNPNSPSLRAAYADLFERLKDSTFLLDPNSYIILEANPACERIIGVAADKLVGRTMMQLVEESMRDAFTKALRVAMRRYHPRQFESHWALSDGRNLTMEILACPLKLDDGQEVLQVIARDVSFRYKQEQKMQVLLRELQAANAKLEVLTTVDEMTGLYNFRHFTNQLQSEHERALRFGTPYSI